MAQVMTRGKVKSRFIINGQSAAKCQVSSIWYAVHRLDGGWYY